MFTLQIHDASHSADEILINRDLFPHLQDGDYVQISDPERLLKLYFKVPSIANQVKLASGRFEVSMLKSITILEDVQLRAFQKVIVEKVQNVGDGEVDFVELAFRRQFLQRGNMWRYKELLCGKAVQNGAHYNVGGVLAQVQHLSKNGQPLPSGIIAPSTHCVFRSRSTRLIWLIQISSEMWSLNANGDMYFEVLLRKLISPLLDKWKSLTVSHSLTVVYFARTIILGCNNPLVDRRSIRESRQIGLNEISEERTEDIYKVVIENVADIDKVSFMRTLKKEFCDFPRLVGWSCMEGYSTDPCDLDKAPSATLFSSSDDFHAYLKKDPGCDIRAVPSDASNGCFLGAINVTLNLLEKHYMDRDLTRTGNSIVMVTAGCGIFKVYPSMALITKQRMMDNGIGLDLISLSSPPIHVVPLFLVSCTSENFQLFDFYEVPHWVNLAFIEDETRAMDALSGESKVTQDEDTEKFVASVTTPFNQRFYLSKYFHARMYGKWLSGEFSLRKVSSKSVLQSSLPSIPRCKGSTDRLSGAGSYSTAISGDWGQHRDDLDWSVHSLNVATSYTAEDAVSSGAVTITNKSRSNTLTEPIDIVSIASASPKSKTSSDLAKSMISNGALLSPSTGNFFESFSLQIMPDKLCPSASEKDCEQLLRMMDEYDSRMDLTLNSLLNSVGAPTRSHRAKSLSITSEEELSASVAQMTTDLSRDDSAAQTRGAITTNPSLMHPTRQVTSILKRSGNSGPNNTVASSLPAENGVALSGSYGTSSEIAGRFSQLSNQIETDTKLVTRYTTKKTNKEHQEKENNLAKAVGGVHGSPRVKHVSMRLTPVTKEKTSAISHSDDNDVTLLANTAKSNSASTLRREPHTDIVEGAGSLNTKRNMLSSSFDASFLQTAVGDAKKQAMNSNDELNQKIEFYKNYRRKYSVNPFKKEEGIAYLQQRTHNRRRWVHVFPQGTQGSKVSGLNWKSLCQPAILPLTTDYLPPVQDIYRHFEIAANYNKILVDDMNVCGYDSHANLLMEMICQRLAMDYQLVEGISILEYRDFFNISYTGQSSHKLSKLALLNSKNVPTSSTLQDLQANALVTGADMLTLNTIGQSVDFKFYVLSMGHRIQFMLYDPFEKQITVRVWVYSKAKNSSDNTEDYTYQLWVPQLQKFQTTTQTFYQYPNVEYGWSNIDEILLGNATLEYSMAKVRAKRLRYIVIPDNFSVEGHLSPLATPPDGINFSFSIGRSASVPMSKQLSLYKSCSVSMQDDCTASINMISLKKWDMVLRNLVTKGATMEEVEIAYQGKFDKLFAHLKKNIASGDSLSVVFGAADEANTGEKGKKKPYQYARLWLSNPGPNPKWVYIRCDNEYNLDNAFHIELSWIACDSWLLDDWVNKLFRRCSSYNLRLVQLPEFFYSSNIQLHSFRAQPFIPIPRSYRGQSSADDDLAAALVVERIYLRQNSLDWIEDNEQYTDWKSVDVPIPLNHYELHHRKHLNLDLNGTPLSSVTDLETILEMQTSSITPPSTPLPAPAVSALTESLAKAKERKESEPEPLQALKLPANSVDGDGLQTATRSHIKERPVPQKDRQYILRLGNGGVRVGNNGFVWLLNAAAKTNDIPAVTSGATTSNSAAPAMITSDEKKDMGLAKLMEFHILCTDVGICLDLLMETIDSAWATIVERASSRVQQKQSILNQMH